MDDLGGLDWIHGEAGVAQQQSAAHLGHQDVASTAEAYGADNSTVGATGGLYRPDTRTPEERQKDDKRHARRRFRQRWGWRLRGLLPRGWKDND